MTNYPYSVPRGVAANVTADATLAKGKHTPVDASGGPVTMTLPTGATAGAVLSVEKVDSSTNAVTVTGSIRGATASLTLVLPFESIDFVADSAGSWRPISGHKTYSSLLNTIGVGWYNVKKYGAKGDGTTDDTAAIQAAITACQNGNGGVVYLPAGKYHITDTLTVGSGSTVPVHLKGDGGGYYNNSAQRTVIDYNGAGTNRAIVFFNQNANGGGISDLVVNQNNSTAGISGILVNGARVSVERVGIGNCKADGLAFIAITGGVHVSESRAFNVFIQNCATGLHLQGNDTANLDCNGLHLAQITVLNSTTNDVVFEDRTRECDILGLSVVSSHGTQPVKIGDGTVAANGNYIVGWIEGVAGQTGVTLANAPGFGGALRIYGVTTLLSGDSNSSWAVWERQTGQWLEGGVRTSARRRCFVNLVDGPDTGVVGTWTPTQSGAAFFDGHGNNGTTNAQNDAGAWYADLEQGTYSLRLYGLSNANGAIATVDISFDGGTTWTAIGTWDQYAASSAAITTVFTGIAVPSKGPAQLRFRALTRNASNTTGWTLRLSAASFVKTA